MSSAPAPIVRIKTNRLLHGADGKLGLEDLLREKQTGANRKLSSTQDSFLQAIDSTYGLTGLFNFHELVSAETEDFDHYRQVIHGELFLMRPISELLGESDLQCDNDKLPSYRTTDRLNGNVIRPTVSNVLYAPGTHAGYMVYGVGGPRILVSHPYRGISRDAYDVYMNSIDVVTSLMSRGYFGTFLFLDNLPGLNEEIDGVPAWAFWFSIIASHSDLVLFIKEHEHFRASQKIEMSLTPDRIQKKIVEIPHAELRWAKKPPGPDAKMTIWLDGGMLDKEQGDAREAMFPRVLIELHMRDSTRPRQELTVIGEGGVISRYPLDYPAYE
jgi:hypothetical protein